MKRIIIVAVFIIAISVSLYIYNSKYRLTGNEDFITGSSYNGDLIVVPYDHVSFSKKMPIKNIKYPCWDTSRNKLAFLKGDKLIIIDKQRRYLWRYFYSDNLNIYKLKWLDKENLIIYYINKNLSTKYVSIVKLLDRSKFSKQLEGNFSSIYGIPLLVNINNKEYYVNDFDVSKNLKQYSAIVTPINNNRSRYLYFFTVKDKFLVDYIKSKPQQCYLVYNEINQIKTINTPNRVLINNNGNILSYTTLDYRNNEENLFLYSNVSNKSSEKLNIDRDYKNYSYQVNVNKIDLKMFKNNLLMIKINYIDHLLEVNNNLEYKESRYSGEDIFIVKRLNISSVRPSLYIMDDKDNIRLKFNNYDLNDITYDSNDNTFFCLDKD